MQGYLSEKNNFMKFSKNLWLLSAIYSGCQKNVPLFERFFATTPYTSLLYFGTYF